MIIRKKTCCASLGPNVSKIEGLVTVDERGQMVLSKAIREKAGIKPGEKLAVTVGERNGRVCCLTLIKIEEFAGVVKDVLGSVVGIKEK